MPPDKDDVNASPDAGLDIESIISGTSDEETTAAASEQATSGQGTEFTWGGRKYQNRQAAEQYHNKLYGEFSKQKEFMNRLKTLAGRDPAAFAALSKDPEWGPILSKLGIQEAEEQVAEDERETDAGGSQGFESLRDEIRVERASMSLEREESQFEKRLGRSLTTEEHNTVMRVISSSPSLSYEQAFKLAFHDKLLSEAQKKAEDAAAKRNPQQRPRPGPLNIPGVKIDTKKKPEDMSDAEWRQNLKESPEFRNLMSRE